MTDLLELDIVTPESRLLSQQAHMVVVPGELGDLGVMAHHAPLISMLRPGMIEIHQDDNAPIRYFVGGGYVNIANNQCSVLAESIIAESELQSDAIKDTLASLEDELQQADSEIQQAALRREIYQEETKLLLAEN